MKNLPIYMISFLFTILLYADINLYYVKNVVSVQNGSRFNYSIDYEVKSYNFISGEFSDTDVCNACKKPLKLVKAPLDKWVVVIEYKLDAPQTIERKNELLKKLKDNFIITPIKKDSNNDVILSYYEVKKIDKPKLKKEPVLSGVRILQNENTYSPKIIIPPNDNFVLLKAMAIDENNNYFKNNNIKLISSCGKLKIKDSSRFSFTFFKDEQRCSVYAKIGKYMSIVEIIKLNKDGSMPTKFNILYKNNSVDKINIDYYTFKRKGIVLKHDLNEENLKWSISDNKKLRMQIINDGIIVYPKKRAKEYKIELIDVKKGLSDSIEILIKNE